MDGGNAKIGLESTIVNLVKKPEILRHGGIEIEKISKAVSSAMSLGSKTSR